MNRASIVVVYPVRISEGDWLAILDDDDCLARSSRLVYLRRGTIDVRIFA